MNVYRSLRHGTRGCPTHPWGSDEWVPPQVLEPRPIDSHSITRASADPAADFKARFKLNLADAFAAALTKELDKEKTAELLTRNREFRPLHHEIKSTG